MVIFLISFTALLLSRSVDSQLYCACVHHCKGNDTCFTAKGACFALIEETLDGRIISSKGCLPPETGSAFQCKATIHVKRKTIECCYNASMCNTGLNPVLPPLKLPDSWFSNNFLYFVSSACITLFILCCLSTIILFFYSKGILHHSKRFRKLIGYSDFFPAPTVNEDDVICVTSGSGSGGLPLLVQRTIGKQLYLQQMVGQGRYGNVWKALWRDEPVAVKIFFTLEEASWCRETEIYQTTLLRHENILGFIAADIRGTGTQTHMLLVTDYHQLGSLYDFLQTHTLDIANMVRMVCSAAAGLTHLHAEILGCQGKPSIAHRDVKSKNILVKNDLTCCIADLGLAVKFDSVKNRVDVGGPNKRVGTKRYMAPEVLRDAFYEPRGIEAYKAADVYSFGLVLWEVVRRTVINDHFEEYQYPYKDLLPNDPSWDEVRNVVVTQKIRPTILNSWGADYRTLQITKIISDCWNADPNARLSALRIKKTLSRMMLPNFLK